MLPICQLNYITISPILHEKSGWKLVSLVLEWIDTCYTLAEGLEPLDSQAIRYKLGIASKTSNNSCVEGLYF